MDNGENWVDLRLMNCELKYEEIKFEWELKENFKIFL